MLNKNKNTCSKCGNKHFPPTGKKCTVWLEATEEEGNTSANYKGSSTVPGEPMTTRNSFVKKRVQMHSEAVVKTYTQKQY